MRRVGECEQVDVALGVVEGDQPVAEHERRVRQRGGVHRPGPALGLELETEIAGEAAGEVEGQLGGIGPQASKPVTAVTEHPLAPELPPRLTLDRERSRLDVVAHDLAERPVGGADEREPSQARALGRAVEPDRVVMVAVERLEHRLGLAPGLEPRWWTRAPAWPGPRRCRSQARRPGESARGRHAPRAGEVAEVLDEPRPCRVLTDSGWNCTPNRGRSLCSSPMTTPSGVQALTLSSAGTAPTTRSGSARKEVLREPGEERALVVLDRAEAPVHHLGRVDHRAARNVSESLVAQADAEHRHFGATERIQGDTDVASVLRSAGTGRDHHVVGIQGGELVPRKLVVADDHRLAVVHLAQEMEEVECVGVVVVDQQRAHPGPHSRACEALVSERCACGMGSTGGWHAGRLKRALTARGHECRFAPVTRMVGRIEGGLGVRSRELALDGCDVVLVRGIPRGSLEQVVFRVDVLHALAAAGVRTVNSAHAIERTVDKFLASALLARAGLPTPRTIACERPGDALEAFAELGGDVIVKRSSAMGVGMVRVDDPDIARGCPCLGARTGPCTTCRKSLLHAERTCERSSSASRWWPDRAEWRGLAHEPRARWRARP